MNKYIHRTGLKLAIMAVLALPELAGAQEFFQDSDSGDVDAGFRKFTPTQEGVELVVYLGNITNFVGLPAGTVTNLLNFSSQLTDMCPDGFGNLQWSAFSSSFTMGTNSWDTPLGPFPADTCWYTVARTNVNVQTAPVRRFSYGSEGTLEERILSVSDNGSTISQELGTTNATNNINLVSESVAAYGPSAGDLDLTASIGDNNTPSLGDFGGGVITFSVENITPSSFTSATVSDLYQNCPNSAGSDLFTDPITGLTNGSAYYVGYFTLNPSGTMTFTRASVVPAAPVAGFTGGPTIGFVPLPVIFTNTSTGSITNWVWNFGNGTIITNTSGSNVTNTYAAGGSYTVTLTVSGPGGSNPDTQASYVVASPTPKITSLTLSAGMLALGATNCPAGVEYRILTSTNLTLPLASWTPVVTNTFLGNGSFSFTNSATNPVTFYRLVSP
jgi:PKD repeat protein